MDASFCCCYLVALILADHPTLAIPQCTVGRPVGRAIVLCRRPFQATVDTEPATHELGRYFLRLRVSKAPCCEDARYSSQGALGFGYSQVCSRPPGGSGNRACRRPFQAAVDTEPATHKLGTHFSGFVSRRHRAAKPEKFASSQGGGLKPACSQDWPPHKRPAIESRAIRRRRQGTGP
jgi:hypothetical protein